MRSLGKIRRFSAARGHSRFRGKIQSWVAFKGTKGLTMPADQS